MTDRELMQQALEALQNTCIRWANVEDAIAALRERLAQPEPVALETVYDTIIYWDETDGKRSRRELARRIVALYPAPQRREWVGLTEEELNLIYAEPQTHIGQYARAIEAKLKEKNA